MVAGSIIDSMHTEIIIQLHKIDGAFGRRFEGLVLVTWEETLTSS